MSEELLDKLTVEQQLNPPNWVVQEAEGSENVRPFMLGWNLAIERMQEERVEYKTTVATHIHDMGLLLQELRNRDMDTVADTLDRNLDELYKRVLGGDNE